MTNKNISYLNKDFSSFKNKLINFAKSYYPNTYNDFSESSPGMMLIEMSSYVGDVLSLYLDNQIQENFLQLSKQRKNLLSQAYVYGYKPQITSVSTVVLDIYQLVPSITISGSIYPDYNYSLNIDEGLSVQSSLDSRIKFIVDDKIDFSKSGSYDNTEVTIYSLDNNQSPEFYLLKKQRKANSGEIKTTSISFTNPERFTTINIDDDKIIKIKSITDSNNEKWYEVPYLAQDTIYEKYDNTNLNSNAQFLLKLKQVSKRFITRIKQNNTLEIQFGSGISSQPDEEIIPNFENVGLGLPYGVNKLYTAFDPSNFLYTNSYGLAPYDTTLTIEYLVGGGVESNIPSNTLTVLNSGNISFNSSNIDTQLSNTIINSLSFNNELPSIGGGDGDSNEDLKLKILSSFPTQLRAVTPDDYLIRTLSLPPEYGLIAKSYVTKSSQEKGDQNLLILYILSKDINNNLIIADDSIKNNLKTYLSQYNSINDAINITDAFIINIGVNFDITLRPNYNNRLVLNNCITALIDYFDIDKKKINDPIILSEIYTLLDKIDGVQTVKNIEIVNKEGENNGYSKYSYDIKAATINNIIYPSLDPSIFEVKYNNDIKGKIVSF